MSGSFSADIINHGLPRPQVDEAWRNSPLMGMITSEQRRALVGGDEEAFTSVATFAFRHLGMPAVFGDFVKPDDTFTARRVKNELQRREVDHTKIGPNAKRNLFNELYGLIERSLDPVETDQFVHELQVASEEMQELSKVIDNRIAQEAGYLAVFDSVPVAE
ncbi:TPA: hypothetical protein EYO12_04065 [Candidatus Saccharibacteria bacterium]|nr:hypothetical protein [Candidatus Saccharibacteria bacterium]HIO87789.1 hypothetical protein [Candidatus Saccharibacteria bacterium]